MSIATSLAALQQAKTDIAAAITNKGGTVNTGDGFADFAADIATISAGSGGVSPQLDNPRGVTFYDYDGTVLESWTLTELQNATALPENPVHAGLTAQGWNWTLAELKSAASPAQVGQHYITSDGKTRVRIMLYESTRIAMNLTLTGASLSVDWGDGSSVETISASTLLYHTYASAGEYVISIACQSGSWQFTPISWEAEPYYGSMIWCSVTNVWIKGVADFVREIWLGSGISALGDGCFYEFPRLKRISVPNTISSCGVHSFYGCRSLFAFVMPKAVGSLSYEVFRESRQLSVLCLPPSFTGNVRGLDYCGLHALCIPNGATKISSYGVQINHPLQCVVIPPSVTSIEAYAFKQCYGLYEVHMLSSTPPTLNSNAFGGKDAGNFTIYVPAGSLAAYQAATNWTVYADYMKEA